MREVQAAADTLRLEVVTLEIRRGEDIAPAFEALKGHADALYVCLDALLLTNRIRINTLALTARLPMMTATRDSVEVGSRVGRRLLLTTDRSLSHLRQAPTSMNGAQTLARRPSRASTAVSAFSTSTSGNAGSWATAPAALRRTAPRPGATVPPIAR